MINKRRHPRFPCAKPGTMFRDSDLQLTTAVVHHGHLVDISLTGCRFVPTSPVEDLSGEHHLIIETALIRFRVVSMTVYGIHCEFLSELSDTTIDYLLK
jgi:hypothetical protein